MSFGNFHRIWPFGLFRVDPSCGASLSEWWQGNGSAVHSGTWPVDSERERKTVLFDESASKAPNAPQARAWLLWLRGFAISEGKHARVIMKGRWRGGSFEASTLYGPNISTCLQECGQFYHRLQMCRQFYIITSTTLVLTL